MAQLPVIAPTPTKRLSVFREVGLVDEGDASRAPVSVLLRPQRPGLRVRFRSSHSIINPTGEANIDPEDDEWEDIDSSEDEQDESLDDPDTIVMNPHVSLAQRLSLLALFIAFALPIVQSYPYFGESMSPQPVPRRGILEQASVMKRQQDLSSTDICARWSQQSAIVNGTLYMYGGRASQRPQQQDNTWNNNFVSLDLTHNWNIDEPSLTGLPQPSGPPPVSNGFLWNSHNSLYLYGGEFSDRPQESPTPFSLWEYDIPGSRWIEHKDPKTSNGGDYAERGGQNVQRTAEGAGASVASLGRGWYFGGHEDFLTTSGWDISVPRIYIKSLLEFTMPGYANNQIESLSNYQLAGEEGAWRNITEGGVQDSNGFPERADGLLVYVPGFSDEGILLGLAGGTNQTFTQMNVIDIYDIAKSTWYKQSTLGGPPKVRVNPCAVVAAAPDGSSYNMYMFGGQNLNATDNTEQDQYQDMWILSIPSFTWIEIKTESQVPAGRSGHTCNVWDGQIIMVGGYTGPESSCDAPGIYVFNLTSLTWGNEFTALTGSSSSGPDDADFNPFSQQGNQLSHKVQGDGGIEGSYGYQVPGPVYSAVGGGPLGGATITKPAVSPTGGPLATGSPVIYTVTGPNGEIITQVANAGNSNNGGGSTNVGAIVAGVVAGVLAIVAGYFAFCAWVYRKQLQLYKNHAAMVAAQTANEKEKFLPPAAVFAASKSSSERQNGQRPDSIAVTAGSHSRNGSSGIGAIGTGYEGRGSMDSSEDLLAGQEPSFWGTRGVLLNPRRSLRVINRD